MISIETIGIALDAGVIPQLIKLKGNLSTVGVTLDAGVVPPKNFFKGSISIVGVSEEMIDATELSILTYQIY